MDTTIDRQHACAFTGHRPARLGFPETDVIGWLEKEIRKAAEDGYTRFITGMQRGVENRWDSAWKKRYHRIRRSADEVHYISDKPGRTAFFQHNNWMVDHASRLIAVYTGAPGGTKETINYAKTQGLEIVNIADGTEGRA